MRLKVWLAGIGVALLLVGSAAILMPRASAQESSTELKRKVRSKVVPEYPPLAKQMNVTGKVKIETTIAADGHVVNTKVIGGSPLLVNAALDALKKWHFEPAAKDTTETIEFEFGGE
jgi:periplasmic protein TonB